MDLQVKGIYQGSTNVVQLSDNFHKRHFQVEVVDGSYKNNIVFELHKNTTKDNLDLISNFHKGDEIIVKFNIQQNHHQGKVYTNLVAWRLIKENESTSQSGASTNFPTSADEPSNMQFS